MQKNFIKCVLAAAMLSLPATYVAAVAYLLLLDPHAPFLGAISTAAQPLFSPLVYVPPAVLVGMAASFIRNMPAPTQTVVLTALSAVAGAFVGWRFTHNAPAIPTIPAVVAAAATWFAVAFSVFKIVRHW